MDYWQIFQDLNLAYIFIVLVGLVRGGYLGATRWIKKHEKKKAKVVKVVWRKPK